jgi:uncharacterized membrane protein YbhN (UPF0104 family)
MNRSDNALRSNRTARLFGQIAIALGIALAGYLIYRGIARYGVAEIVRSVRSVPASSLVETGAYTAASYLCLTGFEWLGTRYIGRSFSYRRVAFVSFVSLALAHSIGFAGLSSGAIRYRFYGRWQVPAADVAKLVVFSGVTVALGLLAFGGATLVLDPSSLAGLTRLPPLAFRLLGVGCLVTVGAYVVLSVKRPDPLRARQWTLEIPPAWIALAQVLLGSVNYLCISAALHAALRPLTDVSLAEVAGAYVAANVLTIASHVPGGLGVIEGMVLYLIPSKSSLIGSVIAFRAVYYFIPLALGLLLFAVAELTFRARGARRSGSQDRPA